MRLAVGIAVFASVAVAGVLGACSRPSNECLVLRQFNLDGTREVLLNQPLVFEFNEDVDPFSVGENSLAIEIVSVDGQVARGRFLVERDTVRFLPRLPSCPDLSDSGLLPEARYRVTVHGGLAFDAVQSLAGGGRIKVSRRFVFETVSPTADRCFIDSDGRERAAIQEESGADVRPGDAFELTFSKHLDPRTLLARNIGVRRTEGGRRGVPHRILAVELEQAEAGSIVRVRTEPGPQAGATYTLVIGDAVRDLGGLSCKAAVTFYGRGEEAP